ncbi:hypothetical protein [Alkaliphilus serpentinus]|nr:hypothetical protein [Alkaliphilus serpentinus]
MNHDCCPYPMMPNVPYIPPQAMPIDPNAIMNSIEPLVLYGMQEAQVTGVHHAMREVAYIAYLMGKGYDDQTARMIVESWEVNEAFPMG